MKIKFVDNFITFDADNKYSQLRFSKEDKKLNHARQKQYFRLKKYLAIASNVEQSKRFSWLYFLFSKKTKKIKNSLEYKNLCSCFDRQISFNNDKQEFTGNEVIPYSITIYDLLPKEYVKEFSKKYISFRESAMDKSVGFGMTTIKNIKESFSNMATQFSKITYHNVDEFEFNEVHILHKYFQSLSLKTRDISHSFLGVCYTLTLSKEMLDLFETLLKSNILRKGHYIDSGTNSKKNYSYTLGGIDSFSKSQAIEDFICELKYQFIAFIKKNIFSKLDEMNIVLPNTILYKCKNFTDVIKEKAKLISIGGLQCDLFFSSSEKTYFQPTNLLFKSNNKFNITNIFADESNFIADKSGSIKAYHIEEVLCHNFALYYLISAIMPEYDKRISKTNEKLNLLLSKRHKAFGALIKLKKETLKQFILFDRLLGELSEIGVEKLLTYIMHSEFENKQYTKMNSFPPLQFKQLFEIAFEQLDKSYNGILKIHDFFDRQLKTVESYANFRTVKISLWVAFLSLVVAVITLVATNDSLINWIKNWFI